jgi:hypothetical protein
MATMATMVVVVAVVLVVVVGKRSSMVSYVPQARREGRARVGSRADICRVSEWCSDRMTEQ